MVKPSEIVIRITQDVPTINKITFTARCPPAENAECICSSSAGMGELGWGWWFNGEYVERCTTQWYHILCVTKINLENIFYVGLESSRKHNNYVFGKNKDWGGSFKLLFIFLLFIALLRRGWYRHKQGRGSESNPQSVEATLWQQTCSHPQPEHVTSDVSKAALAIYIALVFLGSIVKTLILSCGFEVFFAHNNWKVKSLTFEKAL